MLLKNVIPFFQRKVMHAFAVGLCLVIVAACSDTGSSDPMTQHEATSVAPADTSTATLSEAAVAVEALYNKSCISCHISGAAGAPRTGDKAEWQRRLDAKGLDGLIEGVVNGVGSMPPAGLCAQCTRDDYRALILFMAQ